MEGGGAPTKGRVGCADHPLNYPLWPPAREISMLPQVEFHEIFRGWNLGIGVFRGEIRSKNDKKIE
jgi:hypothetical protein